MQSWLNTLILFELSEKVDLGCLWGKSAFCLIIRDLSELCNFAIAKLGIFYQSCGFCNLKLRSEAAPQQTQINLVCVRFALTLQVDGVKMAVFFGEGSLQYAVVNKKVGTE